MSEISKLNGYDLKDKKSVRSYDSVALMKADTDLKEGQHVKTKGYYTAGDGGNAEYVIISEALSTDDANIHELNNGLYAQIIYEQALTPEKFGAYGDNLHDDTSAIQKAINSGIDLYFAKDYLTNGEIQINNPISIYGINNSKIYASISNDQSVFHVLSSNVNFKDLNIDVTYSNPHATSQYGGAITIGSYYMENGFDLNNINIDNCNIIKNISDGMTVGIFGNSHNIKISNCYIKNNGIGMHWSGNFLAGHTPDTKESYHPHNIIIENCLLESAMGVYCSGAYNVEMKNLVFKNNESCIQLVAGDVGEYLTDKGKLMTGIKIENCDFNDCTNHTVFIKGYGTWSGGDNTYNPIEYPNVEITNCNFNDSATNTSANLLRVDYMSGLNVKNCNFNATTRLKHTNFTVIKNSIIDHCYFKAYYEPFNINGCENLVISNCKADLNQNHGFMITQSYTFTPTSTSYLVNDLKLINNKLDNAFKCIVLKNTRHAKLINNMILHSATNIDLDTDNQDMIITGNRFSEYADHYISGHYNIKCSNLINGIIENNYLDGSSGILVATTSSNIKVINNYMSDTYANSGVLIEIPSRTDKKVYLQGNICDKNNEISGSDYSYINYTENS